MNFDKKIGNIIGIVFGIFCVFMFIHGVIKTQKASDHVYKEFPYIKHSDSLSDVVTKKFDVTTLGLRTSSSDFYLKTKNGKSFCFFGNEFKYSKLWQSGFTITIGDSIKKSANSCIVTIIKQNGEKYKFEIFKETEIK